MADVPLTVEQVARSGLAATYTGTLSTADTYQVSNDGKTLLHFKKSGAGNCDVTVVAQTTYYGLTVDDLVVTVTASTGDLFVGPFPPQVFNDGSGLVNFTLSEITGVTVAVLHLA